MILYFTGTGNSKYIAGVLEKQLKDTAVDAAEYIKSGETPCFSSETPYVFVCPIYAWRMPRVFEQWIGQCKFEGNRNAYFLLTCGGSMGAANNYAKLLTTKIELDYMGTAEVVMPENYIVMLSAPTEERVETLISKATEYILQLSQQILAEMAFAEKKNSFVDRFCSDIVTQGFYKFYISSKKFYTTDDCISCGKCVENCVLNNIALQEGKPVWGDACTHCMACICKCPTEAIEYGKHTKGVRRYTCPK